MLLEISYLNQKYFPSQSQTILPISTQLTNLDIANLFLSIAPFITSTSINQHIPGLV